MVDPLNPVTPVVSGAVVDSTNPIPVTVVSGGTSGSIGFPIQSGQVGSVLAGGKIEVASGGVLQIDSGGSETILNGATLTISSGGKESILSAGALTVSAGGAISVTATGAANGSIQLFSGSLLQVSSGAVENVQAGANLNVNSGATLAIAFGGSLNMLGSAVINNGGVLGVSSGGTLTTSAGATINFAAGTVNASTSIMPFEPVTLPYQTGRWYPPAGVTGGGTAAAGSIAGTISSLFAVPFYVNVGQAFTSMGLMVATPAACSANLGIYAANSAGTASGGSPQNATLVSAYAFPINTTATSPISVTTTGLQLSAGWYWLAFNTNSSTTSVQGCVNNAALATGQIFGFPALNNSITSAGFVTSLAFAPMSAVFGGGALVTATIAGSVPAIHMGR